MDDVSCAPPTRTSTIHASLDSRQLQAVLHGDGPLLILAGAGTGKTMTLAHRVAHLIERGADPHRILLLTFTRRAATEMISRVESILRASPASAHGRTVVFGGTFHSVAARLLRAHAHEVGLAPSFTILDRADAEDLIHLCRTELDLVATDGNRFPQKSTCLDIYSRCVNSNAPLKDVLKRHFPWCEAHLDDLATLFDSYTHRKATQHVLDYDDLLLFFHALLESNAGERVRGRFDHVLVDEYQDTNIVQAEILSALRPDGSGVTVVGDDAQAIYSFRGATVRNILDFEDRFPSAHVIVLERSFRSTAPILAVGNVLMSEAAEKREKVLFSQRTGGAKPELLTCSDENEQASWIAERVLAKREEGIPLRRQAVLFRAAQHGAVLEMELARRDIPFVKYGGLKFIESAHVKDLLAVLRLAENPLDTTAALRVLCLLPGVGPKKSLGISEALAEANGDLTAVAGVSVPSAARSAWTELLALMHHLTHAAADDLSAQMHAARVFYAPLCRIRYDSPEPRLGDLERIEATASRFPTRAALLAELALDPPAYTQDFAGPPLLDEEYLVLSTIHSAKGLEFDCVYVIHAADGNIPSDMSCGSGEEIDEERRLFYVACTRARDWLTVTVPLRYYVQPPGGSDRHGYAQPSRFLTPTVRSCFSAAYAHTTESAVLGSASTPDVSADPRASIRRLWQADTA